MADLPPAVPAADVLSAAPIIPPNSSQNGGNALPEPIAASDVAQATPISQLPPPVDASAITSATPDAKYLKTLSPGDIISALYTQMQGDPALKAAYAADTLTDAQKTQLQPFQEAYTARADQMAKTKNVFDAFVPSSGPDTHGILTSALNVLKGLPAAAEDAESATMEHGAELLTGATGVDPVTGHQFDSNGQSQAMATGLAGVKLQAYQAANMVRVFTNRVANRLFSSLQAPGDEQYKDQFNADLLSKYAEQGISEGASMLGGAPYDRQTDAAAAQREAGSLLNPIALIPGAEGAATARGFAARTLGAEAPAEGAMTQAMRQVAGKTMAAPLQAAAFVAKPIANTIEKNPLLAASVSAAGSAALGGSPADIMMTALAGAGEGKVKLLSKLATGVENRANVLAGRMPAGPVSNFAAKAFDVVGDKAIGGVAAQLANTPFLLGSDNREQFEHNLGFGLVAHAAGYAGGSVANALDIRGNLFSARPTMPEARLPVKPYGEDPLLDAAHQNVVSQLGNSGNNFVQAVRDAVAKGGGELYTLAPADYATALDAAATAGHLPQAVADQAKGQQGVQYSVPADPGTPGSEPRQIALSRVGQNTPGISVGHEAGHLLWNLLSPEEQQHWSDSVTQAYGPDARNVYGQKYVDLANQNLGPNDPPISPLTQSQIDEEIFAEHASAALNSIPIAQFSDPSLNGTPGFAHTAYSLIARAMEKLGVKTPELVGGTGVTTGTGIEPSAKLSHIVENLLQAHKLDEPILNGDQQPGGPYVPSGVAEASPVGATEEPNAIAGEQPVGFKKGDEVGSLRPNRETTGVAGNLGDNAVITKVLGPGQISGSKFIKNPTGEPHYAVEYDRPSDGQRMTGVVPESWLQRSAETAAKERTTVSLPEGGKSQTPLKGGDISELPPTNHSLDIAVQRSKGSGYVELVDGSKVGVNPLSGIGPDGSIFDTSNNEFEYTLINKVYDGKGKVLWDKATADKRLPASVAKELGVKQPDPVPQTAQPIAASVRQSPQKQNEAFAKQGSPADIAHNKQLFASIFANPRPVEIVHSGAVTEKKDLDQIGRERERLISEAKASEGDLSAKQPNQKVVVPFKDSGAKEPNEGVFALDTSKILQNKDVLGGWLQTGARLDPVLRAAKDYVSGSEIHKDLQAYLQNQQNGYGGGGERLTRPADTKPGTIPLENSKYTPVPLPEDRVRVLNALMGYRSARSKVNENIIADNDYFRRFAEGNGGRTSKTSLGLAETNPFRARLEKAGFNTDLLNQATSQIRYRDIIGKAVERPDLNVGSGSTGITKAGFMPNPENEYEEDFKQSQAEQYFSIGHNNELNNWTGGDETEPEPASDDNWIYDPSARTIKSKKGGTHGINFGHEVAGRSFKGWHDNTTKETSVVFPENELRKLQGPPTQDDIPTSVYNALKRKFPDTTKFVAFMPDVNRTIGAENEHARYIGEQEGATPGEHFPLYNLKHDIPGHPKDSTVGAETLKAAGLPLPGDDKGARFMPPADPTKKHVKEAAVEIGGRVFTGEYHQDALHRAHAAGAIERPEYDGYDRKQGFITSKGRFISREDAFAMARATGQVTKANTFNEERYAKMGNRAPALDAADLEHKYNPNTAVRFMPDVTQAPKKEQAKALKAWMEKGTDSPYFKKWFADSKVVDDKDLPKIVYHGTDSDHTTFKEGVAFFTDNKVIANQYRERKIFENSDVQLLDDVNSVDELGLEGVRDIAKEEGVDLSGGTVISAFLSLKTPLDISHLGANLNPREDWDALHDLGIVPEKWKDLDEYAQQEVEDEFGGKALWNFLDSEGHLPIIKKGHDGLIFNDVDMGGRTHLSYAVFKPEQIKSATNNNGEFNIQNPDIRFQPNAEKPLANVKPTRTKLTALPTTQKKTRLKK